MPLFRISYSSLTDVVDNLFCKGANRKPEPEELKKDQMKITDLIAQQCATRTKRTFDLFAVDCSPHARIPSKNL